MARATRITRAPDPRPPADNDTSPEARSNLRILQELTHALASLSLQHSRAVGILKQLSESTLKHHARLNQLERYLGFVPAPRQPPELRVIEGGAMPRRSRKRRFKLSLVASS